MKRIAWALSVFAVTALAILGGVMLYPSQSSSTLPTSDSVDPPMLHQPPAPWPAEAVLIAITQRNIARDIPVYSLNIDNPGYLLAGHVPPHGVLVRVHATFINASDSNLALDELKDFTLLDEDGEQYSASTPATVRPLGTKYRRTPIAEMRLRPWGRYDALLYFDLPETVAWGELRLRFRDSPTTSFHILDDS